MADINPSDKAPLTCSFTTRVRMHDVEGELQIAGGTLREIRDAVGKLREIRGIALVETPRAWQRTPEGEPICPKHGAVMKERKKQGIPGTITTSRPRTPRSTTAPMCPRTRPAGTTRSGFEQK